MCEAFDENTGLKSKSKKIKSTDVKRPRSRSTWPFIVFQELPALHGEKSPIVLVLNSETMLNNSAQILQLPQILAVNCGDYQTPSSRSEPIKESNQAKDIDSVLKPTVSESVVYSTGQLAYSEQKALKLEMEEFLDLSQFPTPISPQIQQKAEFALSSVDELNTPIFEAKEPFNYNIRNNFDYKHHHIDTINNEDIKCASVSVQTTNNASMQPIPEFSSSAWDMAAESALNSGNKLVSSNPSLSSFSGNTNNSTGSSTICEAEYKNMIDYDEDDVANMVTVNNFSDILNKTDASGIPLTISHHSTNNTPTETYFMLDTPEDSLCSNRSTPQLKLDINAANNYNLKPEEEIKTSDVLDTIDELSSTDFQLFDFLENDSDILDVTDSNNFNVESNHSSEIPSSSSYTIEPITVPAKKNTKSTKRKSRYNDDDDEDYVPPMKSRSSTSSYIKVEVDYSEDSSDSIQRPIKRRGRPPKSSSLSTENYGNSPPSKYRELRDKNNEASRKSRLKRKQKECEFEREADELNYKNQKLRVQVQELERMIESMKKDLLTVMLKK